MVMEGDPRLGGEHVMHSREDVSQNCTLETLHNCTKQCHSNELNTNLRGKNGYHNTFSKEERLLGDTESGL